MSSLHRFCCCERSIGYFLFRTSISTYEIFAVEDIGSSGVVLWSNSYPSNTSHQGQIWHHSGNIYAAIPTNSPDHNIYKINAYDGSTVISKYMHAPTDQTPLDRLGICVSETEEVFVITEDTPIFGASFYKLDSNLDMIASGSVNSTQPAWNGEERPTIKQENAGAHRTLSIQEGGQPCWGNKSTSAHRLNNDLSRPALSSSHWRSATDAFGTAQGEPHAPNIFIGGSTVILPIPQNGARAKIIPSYATFTDSSYNVIGNPTIVGTFACNGTATSGNVWGCTLTHLIKRSTDSNLYNATYRYLKRLGYEDFFPDITFSSFVYMNLLRYTNGDLWITAKDWGASKKFILGCFEEVGTSGLVEKWRLDIYNHPDLNIPVGWELVNWYLNCEGGGYDNPAVITWK